LATLDGIDHTSVLTDERLIIKRSQAPHRVRKFHIIVGISGKLRTLKINNASIDTLSAALLERMYYCRVGEEFLPPPEVKEHTVHSTLKNFRSSLLKKFGPCPTKLCPEEFVDMFRGRKKKIYSNYLDEFYESGVLRKHSVSAAFVKCEKVNPLKAPRCIQPRHPVYNIGLGCYLKHIEHRLYRAIDRVFGEKNIVIKGYNVREIGNIVAQKWNSFGNPIGIGLDATKFDMHVSEAMLKWEHSIYESLYKGDKELKRLLSYQRDNKGVGYCDDGKLSYRVKGRRFSGDMNTALGNCIIMCAMVHTYAKERGVPIRFINNGDDCVVFMEKEYESRFISGLDEWFLELGFRMTREPTVNAMSQVEFCQMRPLRVDGGYTMVRNFDTAREKDSLCLLPLNSEGAMRKWLYAVGECGLALCSGVPVMQSMYECYMRNGVASKMGGAVQMQSGMRMLAVGLESKKSDVMDDTRVDFMEAWGYTPDEQVALEEYYNNLQIDYENNTVDNFIEINSSPF